MFPTIQWNLISLELLLTSILVGLVVVDMFLPKKTSRDWMGILSFMGIIIAVMFWLACPQHRGMTFQGMFISDSLSWFFKGFFLLTMLFIFPMTFEFFKPLSQRRNELYLLLWIALLGMCFIASSSDFLILFISLEILTISLYVMTAYLKKDKHSLEAGMKYLILGSLASGFLLYGISFLYGVTHSTHFEVIHAYTMTHAMNPAMLFALVLIVAAIGFKIAAFPFHMWVPDVYQGAPTPVTALLSIGSKAAGFIILIRLFFGIFSAWHLEWSLALACLSAITMTYGNLVALFQTNIKRLLAYSSISHAGYLLMGAAAGTTLGASAMNMYLLGYLFTTLGAFVVIIIFSNSTQSDEIKDYRGLSKRSNLLCITMLLAMVSLAGLPPLAGFFGKFTLLMATMKSGFLWLAVVASINIVISLYYYLRVVQQMFVHPSPSNVLIPVSAPMRLLLIFAILGIIVIGMFPGPFLDVAMAGIQGMAFVQR